ncbi:hypothetical protein PHMEG_0009596 [Phytophthora megakarya]|uniref:Reverse transcriptase RNase H-like domain-containing protein n=1 Tax=Phytophthora megakarya TaxID=4795 RepID=A0A225WHI7_9STRA|nr:hypothetical protein PHMEG_0009596 [Phytophthora megakarya]
MKGSIVGYARAVDPPNTDSMHLLKDTERAAFGQTEDLLATAATIALPGGFATTIVFDYDTTLSVATQQHKLITCLRGTFKDSQLNGAVIEKETYPIVKTYEKLDFLLMRPMLVMLCFDHRNLIHVFAPHVSIKKNIRFKWQRSELKLMPYQFVIEHVDGEGNVWAEMLSTGHPTTRVKLKRFINKRVNSKRATPNSRQNPRSLDDEGFVWPSLDQIRTVQQQKTLVDAVSDGGGILRVDERIWIPREVSDLKQRGKATGITIVNSLQRDLHASAIRGVVHTFVSNCLLSPPGKGPQMIHR